MWFFFTQTVTFLIKDAIHSASEIIMLQWQTKGKEKWQVKSPVLLQ